MEEGEIIEEGSEIATDEEKEVAFDAGEAVNENGSQGERKQSNWSQRDGGQRLPKMV